MGQDTYVDFGVSVSLKSLPETIELIRKLIANQITQYDEFGIRCYIIVDYDEIESYNDADVNVGDESSFGTEFKFLITCAKAYARNISRRDNPFIFGNDDADRVEDLCVKLARAKDMFVELGVAPELIWTGYTILDSY
jgi:hypothetical protein